MSTAKKKFKLALIIVVAVFISFQVYKAWYATNHKDYARLYITIPESGYEELRTYLGALSKNHCYVHKDKSDMFSKWGYEASGNITREEFTSRYKDSYEDIYTNPKYYEDFVAKNPYQVESKRTLHIEIFDWKQFGFFVLSVCGYLNNPDNPNAITIKTKKTFEQLMPKLQFDLERKWQNSTKVKILSE